MFIVAVACPQALSQASCSGDRMPLGSVVGGGSRCRVSGQEGETFEQERRKKGLSFFRSLQVISSSAA